MGLLKTWRELIESWKGALYADFLIGTVLMDPSKAFKRILHDSLLAWLHAYGLKWKKCLVYSYLRGRKQNVKMDDTQ